MTETDAIEAATAVFEQAWRDLAVVFDEAKAHSDEAAKNPALLADPVIDTEVRWLVVFNRELNDVLTVHQSLARGAKLPTGSVRAATDAARKLLQIFNQGRVVAQREPATVMSAQVI